MRAILGLLCLVVLFNGCSTPPGYLGYTKLPEFEDGKTTLQEVLSKMPAPSAGMRDPTGHTLTHWREALIEATPTGRLAGATVSEPIMVRCRNVSLHFDERGVLLRHLVSVALIPGRGNVSEMAFGPDIGPNELAWIKPGQTTEAELVQRLGPPAGQILTFADDLDLLWQWGSKRNDEFSRWERRALMVTLDGQGLVQGSRAIDDTKAGRDAGRQNRK